MLKYLILGLIIYVALRYAPLELTNERIIGIVALGVLGYYIFNTMFMKEAMSSLPGCAGRFCDHSYKFPKRNMMNNMQQDYSHTYLDHDNDTPVNPLLQHGQPEYLMSFDKVRAELEKQRYNKIPGYYLAADGQYAEGGIPYDKAMELIQNSKLNDLYHQHNHYIKWSPHTHIGKARGRVNWVLPNIE